MKAKRFGRTVLQTLAVTALFGMTAAHAETVAFQSEMHTGNNFMAFFLPTISDRDILQIDVWLGAGAVFDPMDSTKPLGSTSPSRPINVGHFNPAWSATSTNADIGLVGPLADAFSADRKRATFKFTNFKPGKAWGVFVDFDPTGLSDDDASGPAMNGLRVEVIFPGGATLTSSCSDPNVGPECHGTFGGKKKSFPSSAIAEVAAAEIPEPVSGLLMASGLVAGVLIRRIRSGVRRF